MNRCKGIIFRDFEQYFFFFSLQKNRKMFQSFQDLHFNTNIHIDENESIYNYFDSKYTLIHNGCNGVYTCMFSFLLDCDANRS